MKAWFPLSVSVAPADTSRVPLPAKTMFPVVQLNDPAARFIVPLDTVAGLIVELLPVPPPRALTVADQPMTAVPQLSGPLTVSVLVPWTVPTSRYTVVAASAAVSACRSSKADVALPPRRWNVPAPVIAEPALSVNVPVENLTSAPASAWSVPLLVIPESNWRVADDDRIGPALVTVSPAWKLAVPLPRAFTSVPPALIVNGADPA